MVEGTHLTDRDKHTHMKVANIYTTKHLIWCSRGKLDFQVIYVSHISFKSLVVLIRIGGRAVVWTFSASCAWIWNLYQIEHPLSRLCTQSAFFGFVGFVAAKHETFITYLTMNSSHVIIYLFLFVHRTFIICSWDNVKHKNIQPPNILTASNLMNSWANTFTMAQNVLFRLNATRFLMRDFCLQFKIRSNCLICGPVKVLM